MNFDDINKMKFSTRILSTFNKLARYYAEDQKITPDEALKNLKVELSAVNPSDFKKWLERKKGRMYRIKYKSVRSEFMKQKYSSDPTYQKKVSASSINRYYRLKDLKDQV